MAHERTKWREKLEATSPQRARDVYGVDGEIERSKRELEAEAVGYIVGRYFGLDTSGSAFYLAAWEDNEPEAIIDRLEQTAR